MLVGVTTRVVQAPSYWEPRDAISQDWERYLCGLGYMPVPIPNALEDPIEFLVSLGIGCLVLTNGEDPGPLPPQPPFPEEEPDLLRDRTEFALLSHAVEHRLPVMGVCRGMQFINVFFGGRLQAVADLGLDPESHVTGRHPVSLTGEGPLPGWRGEVMVNSYHRSAVTPAGLADDLLPLAVDAGGGVCEALCHRTLPIVGIQWHPERANPAAELDRRLIHKILGSPEDGSRS